MLTGTLREAYEYTCMCRSGSLYNTGLGKLVLSSGFRYASFLPPSLWCYQHMPLSWLIIWPERPLYGPDGPWNKFWGCKPSMVLSMVGFYLEFDVDTCTRVTIWPQLPTETTRRSTRESTGWSAPPPTEKKRVGRRDIFKFASCERFYRRTSAYFKILYCSV